MIVMWFPRLMWTSRGLSTSSVACARRPKRLKVVSEMKEIRLTSGKPQIFDPVVPTSPLTKTEHPVNRFEEEERSLQAAIRERSAADAPLSHAAYPYSKKDAMCILCPRRYAVPITPDYKNPKLLAQFVSPHTGLVYQKHITGLCQDMQHRVEKAVLRAQSTGTSNA